MEAKQNIHLVVTAVVVLALSIALFIFTHAEQLLAGDGGTDAQACTMVATTTVVIGNQSSTQIVAAAANNAYVIISQPPNASNTVAIGFGVTPSLTTSSYLLASSSMSIIPDRLVLGLNTDFPYVGAINAITNISSTSVGVTVCRYI